MLILAKYCKGKFEMACFAIVRNLKDFYILCGELKETSKSNADFSKMQQKVLLMLQFIALGSLGYDTWYRTQP